MAVVADFVVIRFASRPFGFMREADESVKDWLILKKIPFTQDGQKLYFELPSDLDKFTRITPEVCDILKPFAGEVKKSLMALSFMKARKFRQPLSSYEIICLAEAGLTVIL